MDKEGIVQIPFGFKFSNGFHSGLASVLVGNRYGVINKSGEIVIEPKIQ
ncbi:WG repeat-containing protein [Paenibacillus sp. NPDC056579]